MSEYSDKFDPSKLSKALKDLRFPDDSGLKNSLDLSGADIGLDLWTLYNGQEKSGLRRINKDIFEFSPSSDSPLCYKVNLSAGYVSVRLSALAASAIKGIGMGGIGITAREWIDVDEIAPGLRDLVSNNLDGRIVFLGNGFSDYPLHLLNHQLSSEAPTPVIVDVFDYEQAAQDLPLVRAQLDDLGIRHPRFLDTMERIARSISRGEIIALNYQIEDPEKPAPELITNAQLAINIMGPSMLCLDSQRALLAPGGHLYFTQIEAPLLFDEPVPEGFMRRNEGSFGSWVFTRK